MARVCMPLTADAASVARTTRQIGADIPASQAIREVFHNTLPTAAAVRFGALTVGSTLKLACADNGIGMSPAEMALYLGRPGSSRDRHGRDVYGIGSKVATAVHNPAGVEYISLVEGATAAFRCRIISDRDGAMGFASLNKNAADFSDLLPVDRVAAFDETGATVEFHWAAFEPVSFAELVGIEDALSFKADSPDRPSVRGSGTIAVLHGARPGDWTIARPADLGVPVTKGRFQGSKWIGRFLTSRYAQLPDTVTVATVEIAGGPGDDGATIRERFKTRTVTGLWSHLDDSSTASGQVALGDGSVARWWLVDEAKRRATKDAVDLTGHVALSLRDGDTVELYDTNRTHRPATFGIICGAASVVIHVEPAPELGVRPRQQRDGANGGNTPIETLWDQWGNAFVDAMPAEIVEHMAKAKAPDSESMGRKARKRSEVLLDWLTRTTWKLTPAAGGDAVTGNLVRTESTGTELDHDRREHSGDNRGQTQPRRNDGTTGAADGASVTSTDRIDGTCTAKARRSRISEEDIPDADWDEVSESDVLARLDGNRITLFRRWQGLTKFTDELVRQMYATGNIPRNASKAYVRTGAENAARQAISTALIQYVMVTRSALIPSVGAAWSPEASGQALSPETLTAVGYYELFSDPNRLRHSAGLSLKWKNV